ncbi:hypothetical protein [Kordiimonas sp.]
MAFKKVGGGSFGVYKNEPDQNWGGIICGLIVAGVILYAIFS